MLLALRAALTKVSDYIILTACINKCLWDTMELPDAKLPAKQAIHMIATFLT